jgi:DNA sulfur modification protein DndB
MTRRYLPALRGLFGDWAYYSCLMSLRELAERVSFAAEIHKSKALSDMIQRELKDGRSSDIAHYLKTNPERFFSSLVVAVYGGDPAWHQLDEIKPQGGDLDLASVSDDAVASLGFLSFTGEEKLFALDGQHRLAGIQEALQADQNIGDDEASVIFVSHRNDIHGLMRTRRLFTTLNKTAKAVTKGEIIALDEADVMAIVVRDLVENHSRFSDKHILISPTANLPTTNNSHLTTIVNLYDVLTILFSKVNAITPVKDLQFNRPTDEELAGYRQFTIRYFTLLANAIPELKEYFASRKPAEVVKKYRHLDGGNVLFRPVGLTMFAHLTEAAIKEHTLEKAVALLGKLPTDLSVAPYVDLLWNPSTRTLDLRRQALVRRLLLYALGFTKGQNKLTKLKADVAKARGMEPKDVVLPAIV